MFLAKKKQLIIFKICKICNKRNEIFNPTNIADVIYNFKSATHAALSHRYADILISCKNDKFDVIFYITKECLDQASFTNEISFNS